MKLSPRLEAIFKYIERLDKVADIGSDHGLLAIEIRRRKAANFVLATENKPGPFSRLLSTVRSSGVSNIDVMFTDGLDNIPSTINTVIIAGMGGSTIHEILTRDQAPLAQLHKLILLPHSEAALLRKDIPQFGFRISREEIIQEDDLFYELIVFEVGAATYSEDEVLFGPINLSEKTSEFKAKWAKVYQENERLLSLNLDQNKREELESLQVRIKNL